MERWTTEDEMVEWHHQLNERKSEQTLGDYDIGNYVIKVIRYLIFLLSIYRLLNENVHLNAKSDDFYLF